MKKFAFSSCENLKSVEISNGVTSIGGLAFSNCSNLETIIIPKSVTYMGNDVFWKCDKLTIYCGTLPTDVLWEDNWNSSMCHVVWNYQK